MNFLKNIISFFKNLFIKNEPVKMLEATKIDENSIRKNIFVDSLKISTPKHENPNIEVPTCVGDGLGIQPKISF